MPTNIEQTHIENVVVSLISTSTEKVSEGIVYVQYWGSKDRFKRAAKFASASFGVGILSVVAPPIHWVTVPVLVLGSPFVFYFFYHQESFITGGKGLCPNCSADFEVAKGPNRFPINDVCTKCRSSVKIERR